MPVFKLCLHIYKKNLKTMMIYFIIFLGLAFLFVGATQSNDQKGFNQTKANIAFISKDNSPLVEGLRDSLEQIATIIDVSDEKSAIQDALYFREVSYVLRVPADYTNKFMAGEKVLLEKTTLPNSVDAIYINLQVDQYLKLAKVYMTSTDIDVETLANYVSEDMKIATDVEMLQTSGSSLDQSYSMYYFNFMAYSLFSVLILGISTVLLVFNGLDVRRRNSCSPIKASHMNIQFLLANITFSIVCWAVYITFCILINFKNIQSANMLLFMLNSFVFTICAASISFLIGTLVKNREAISALANVVALGSSFISGVFVPQAILSDSVLKIASFTPTYWFVRANNLIASMTKITEIHLADLFGYIGVELGFAIAFIALALVVGKQKQLSAES